MTGTFLPYHRVLSDSLVVASARPDHAEQLEELQRWFSRRSPTTSGSRRRTTASTSSCFPRGSSSASTTNGSSAATATIRLHFDFEHTNHTFADIIQGGWLTSHEPDGDWLYGADVGVHPAYRGRGLAHALYAARQELVWRLGLRGR